MVWLKALAIWLLLAVLAILNGLLRVEVLVPLLGEQWALPMSGVILSLLILLTVWLVFPWLGPAGKSRRWRLGLFWLALTLVFEFGFGRFVAGKSWPELLSAYDVTSGNLWLLVLATIAAAPTLAAKPR